MVGKAHNLLQIISDDRFEFAKRYFESYREHSAVPAQDSLVFEFGAGGELFMTLCEAAFGFKRIVSTDIAHWLNPVYIEKAAEYVKSKTGFPNGNVKWHSEECEKILSETFNIDYFVADARHTSFPDNHVDFVFANAVLEHIPKAVLKDILRECFRISKPGSLLAFEIDYRDHGFRSGGYSPYVFLRYSKKYWDKNPPSGLNRMRHRDYGVLFREQGFDIVEESVVSPFDPKFNSLQRNRDLYHSAESLIESLQSIKLDTTFADYRLEELAILTGFWVLRKPL